MKRAQGAMIVEMIASTRICHRHNKTNGHEEDISACCYEIVRAWVLTDIRGVPDTGEMICATAMPSGLAAGNIKVSAMAVPGRSLQIDEPIEINIVAVVLPLRSNHVSE